MEKRSRIVRAAPRKISVPLAQLMPARIALVSACVALALGCVTSAAAAAPGEPDPTFGNDGVLEHQFAVQPADSGSSYRAVALAPGGKIDLVGVRDESDDREVLVARLTEQGTFDSSFGTSGALATPFRPPTPHQITLQTGEAELVEGDGAIVAGGREVAARITPTGQLDPGFEREINRIEIHAILALPNGDLLFAGGQGEGPEPSSPRPGILEQVLPDGQRDTSFGHEGQVVLPAPSRAWVQERIQTAIALPEGKFLLGGSGACATLQTGSDGCSWVARVDSDGSLDTSFGTNGIVYVPNYGEVALVRESTGRIILFGAGRTETPGPWSEAQGWQTVAWGLTAQGAPDPTFGEDGMTRIPVSAPELSDFVAAAAIDNEGRILVASNQVKLSDYGGPAVIARLTPSGQLDTSYGQDGLAVGVEGSNFAALAVDPSGRAIAAGTGPNGTLVERFQGDQAPNVSPQPADGGSGGAQSEPPSTNEGSQSRSPGGSDGTPQTTTPGSSATSNHTTSPPVAAWKVNCAPAETHPNTALDRSKLRCVLRIDRVHGRWSAAEATLALGATRVAHAGTHWSRTPAQFELALTLKASPHPTSYQLTLTFRRGGNSAHLGASIVLSARR